MSTAPLSEFELQPRTAAHAPGMFEVLRDPRLYTYLDYGPPASEEYLQSLYTRFAGPLSPDGSEVWLNWVINVRGQSAGYVQATVPVDRGFAWVAYMLGHDFWGMGLGSAATGAMIELLRTDYQITRFLACVEADNTRSIGVLRKLNFVPASAEELATHDLSPTERLYVLQQQNM
jgi:[ribosomal protein S5]-alanine N-acetyltransferase